MDKDTGIVLVTEKIASLVREEINSIKLEKSIPLIVEVPDRHGTVMEKDRITRYIREAIGVKI
jgi:V/A-type H+-transporting ATPase subunit F